MRTPLTAGPALLLLLVSTAAAPAGHTDDHPEVEAGSTAILLSGTANSGATNDLKPLSEGEIGPVGSGTSSGGTSASSAVQVAQIEANPICESVNGGGCVTTYACADGQAATSYYYYDASGGLIGQGDSCPESAEPAAAVPAAAGAPAPPRVTTAMVQQAFERIPLPDSEIAMNPGGNETLVNYPTSFYTEADPFTETVDFFGGRITIQLQITPTTYTWHHGDGTTATTDHPGRARVQSDAYAEPDLIIHEYVSTAADIPTAVDTTWSATWTLNGQDMGAVPGTVTIDGAPAPIDVLEARPVLVH